MYYRRMIPGTRTRHPRLVYHIRRYLKLLDFRLLALGDAVNLHKLY
jgi:hypothetical protein